MIKKWKPYCYGVIAIFFTFLPTYAFTQNHDVNFGDFYFSLSPKILKYGTINDLTFGYNYTKSLTSELRLRFSYVTKKEQFDKTLPDSLNIIEENNIETFFIPLKYYFIKNSYIESVAGAGIYYGYNKLTENGYFNMPSLEILGKEKVNSFSNNFSRHVVGPDIEIDFIYHANWLNVSVRGGIVPIFYLHAYQKMGIIPLLEPNYADYSQNTWGIPYFYTDVNIILFRYISFTLLYDFSRLNYQVIDFDNNLNWNTVDRNVITQSFKLEASLLIPLGIDIYTQLGYGHTFDSTKIDSVSPIHSSKQYLIFSVRKMK
jgi:hypothetical protein